MSKTIQFTSTALKGGKKGIISADSDGYYTMIIGGLNVFNSAGEYYTLNKAKELFEQSSLFMRRVKAGVLKAELGHPRREPGQSDDEYINRILDIRETNICAHFSDVWLDFDNVKDNQGKTVVAIMAKVKPSGPHAKVLQDSLDNPKEDTCFSIRAFTEDTMVGGIKNRVLTSIVTFDFVLESGIHFARKYFNPGLESVSEQSFDKEGLKQLLKTTKNTTAMESFSNRLKEVLDSYAPSDRGVAKPVYHNW